MMRPQSQAQGIVLRLGMPFNINRELEMASKSPSLTNTAT